MLVDLRPKGLNGKVAQETLDHAGITVNKNGIPFDTEPIITAGGIRVGTPAVTTRGMKEAEMIAIAGLMARALAIPKTSPPSQQFATRSSPSTRASPCRELLRTRWNGCQTD